MILKSFLIGNLVSLCMKIINSVVVVGLYYGFLTTFSVGPSYLFLLRARIIEEGEEGIEKKVSATTGFITGQLMMFISIYYAPLHLALGRPHTITVLALPYLLFHFFWNNHKHFFDYGSTTRNSMRNLSSQCVFLTNLIFQLFNYFILPSSMLVRLVNIYMFRCNNKILFVTSSFVGWLIGHILFMKWVGLVLVWIQQKNSIRSNKYLVSELRNSMARIFSILLFITCVYDLGRVPSPIITNKLKETSETEESEEETDVEIETTSETKGTKQEQEESTEEDPSPSLFSEEKEDPDKIDKTEEIRMNGKEKTKDEFHFKETRYKNRPIYETSYLDGNQENSKLEIFKDKKDKEIFWFDKPLVTILFNYKRWNRPFRYKKKNGLSYAMKNEMSQYYFYTCQSDGKERISLMYPPSLSIFLEMIQRKMSLFRIETNYYNENEQYNHWNYTNEQKKNNISNKFINIVKILDKKFIYLDIIEKKIRLCNNETQKEYVPKIHDPFLNGPPRGQIKKSFLFSIIKTSIKHYIETIWINKIHGILLTTNYIEFARKVNLFDSLFDRKSLSTEISYFLNFVSKFAVKSTSNFNLKGIFLFPFLFSEKKQVKIDSEDRIKIYKFLFNAVIMDHKDKKIREKYIGIKEINKKVPRWSYKLINELEQEEEETNESLSTDPQILSRKAKRVVVLTAIPENTDFYTTKKKINNPLQTEEMAFINYSIHSDFRRDIIKGSARAQRRKTFIWELWQANVHSPLFLDRLDKPLLFSFDIFELSKINFLNWIWKKNELKISDYTKEKTKQSEKKEEEGKRQGKTGIEFDIEMTEVAEAWENGFFSQLMRSFLLIIQSIFRKYILLPSLIIVKNIVRILLFQVPEWSEDLKDWNKEMHIICTYNGIQLAENEFPKNWVIDGIQIKILFPFRLKPWHRSKLRSPHKDSIKKKNKGQKNDFYFLTVAGMQTELPFGSPRKQLSFLEPVFKEFEKKKLKLKKKSFLVLKILKERTKSFLSVLFLNVSKEIKKWVIQIKEFSKINQILLFGLKKIEIYELSETKKETNWVIPNKTIPESPSQIPFLDYETYSLTEKEIKNLTNRTNTIINQIEKIKKDKKRGFITRGTKINPNKINYEDKRLESPKNIWHILKRKNIRLLRKSHYYFHFFIEKIYINIFLRIINIPRINAQLFIELTKKKINKYVYNNEANRERIDKTNPSIINFISILKRLLYINKNSHICLDLSYLSQAYVFYKLSQTQANNLYKLRSIFKYYRTPFFIKNEIKEYFVGTQEIFDFELRQHKNLPNSLINEWKNWLKSHYQYDLSQISWLRLVPKKWRNTVNEYQCRMINNKDLDKCDSYEKNRLIRYEKKKIFEIDSLLNQKENFKKQYKYDFFSYKSINYEDKKDLYIDEMPLQVKNKQEISYTYNTSKYKPFGMMENILINNYLVENDSIDRETNLDRKYLDWKIINFCARNTNDIKAWVDIDTVPNRNKNTKTGINNYQITDKIDKKGLFYLTIHQDPKIHPFNQKKSFVDWMGMNEEILISRPISNLELWFFPEFVILYNTYKIKPWVIPIQFLLFHFNVNKNVNKHRSTIQKKKRDIFIFSNEKKTLELGNQNQGEKEFADQADLESALSNQEKDVEEDYTSSYMKKRINKKQYKNNTKEELEFFLKRYLHFQLRWDDSLNQKMMNNIKVYCLLLRMRDPREIVLSSIQRKEMNLDIMMAQKDLTFTDTELMKKGILIIEPVRLFVKNKGQFIIYQTIGISLLHKSKHQSNQKYLEKSYVYVDKNNNNFSQSIAIHHKMIENIDKNNNNLLVLENILSPRRRRELRILISFYSRNRKNIHKNTVFCNGNKVKTCDQVLSKKIRNIDKDKNKLIKLKLFLWPNYRLEDLACMNRYWFDTNNGSRFSMTRLHLYPRLKND
uniref:Protein TIC 214 n=1 Tax=Casuarina glauca TaxID=3522 RepID=A0A4Y5T1L5_CASGL|nr:Ycf1 [Casuarina glauca]QDA81701.1 Ycf1 [Casuarina glauca]QXF29398.1 Ycf1 [Casuarina equisetifolia]